MPRGGRRVGRAELLLESGRGHRCRYGIDVAVSVFAVAMVAVDVVVVVVVAGSGETAAAGGAVAFFSVLRTPPTYRPLDIPDLRSGYIQHVMQVVTLLPHRLISAPR